MVLRYFIKGVHAEEEILGEHLVGRLHVNHVAFLGGYLERVVLREALKHGSSAVNEVFALAEVEIEDADGVDLLHLVVFVAQVDVFGDGFRNAVEDAFEVVDFARQLDFHNDDFFLAVSRLDVHAVELVGRVILVALAFENLQDMDGLSEQHGEEAFEDGEVLLVAENFLRGPVKADVSVQWHIVRFWKSRFVPAFFLLQK